MKKRISFIFIVSTLVFFAFFQQGKGYDDKTTHPGLTDEMVDFYNASFDAKLTSEEKEWVVQGAIDEDFPPRWINHFYDPMRNEGWKAENLGTVSSSTLRFLSGIFFNINTEIVSSKQWVHDEVLQTRYTSYGGNNTWENAVRQYANGNKKEAYHILGHVLHLLEDKTVPDHTRNDTHAHEGSILTGDGGSPYEDYGKNFNQENLTIASDLQKENKKPLILPSLNDYIEHLAKYSNGYFFSEHTINSSKYSNPKSTREDEFYIYGKDLEGDEFPLTEIKLITKENFDTEKSYTLKNKFVLSSYFSRLTQEAVLSGAGVIKLFHEEAEKAIQDKSSISPAPQISWWQKMRSPLYGGVALYNNASGFIRQSFTSVANAFSSFSLSLLSSQLAGLIPADAQPQALPAAIPQEPSAPALVPVTSVALAPSQEPQLPQLPKVAPPTSIPSVPNAQVSDPPVNNDAPTPIDSGGVPAVSTNDIVLAPVPVFRGNGSVTGISPDALAAQNSPSAPAVEEQATTADTFATSTDDAVTETTAMTTDSTATSTDPVIDETATTTEDVIPTATSTDPVVVDSIIPITDFTDSVVINEAAWMGTKAQANDEWIELYNKTNSDIDLSGWSIESKRKALSVALSGVISAHGYFLLERTASTTTDVAENMIFSGSINNAGPDANLYLKNGTTTIDSVDFGYWIAGDNGKRYTMERVSAYATSTLAANWKNYGDPDTVPFAKDANGDDIFGTPGRKNSVSGFYMPVGNITEDTVWRKIYSPYFVSGPIVVSAGVTLTIEPGVVVKLANGTPYGGVIDVRGILKAEGSPTDSIVFTSFHDDAVDGIDSNRDRTVLLPAPGDWMNINFYNADIPSLLRYAQIRYGGQGINMNPNGWYPTYTGVLSVRGGGVEISDSRIEDNAAFAVYVSGPMQPKIYRNMIQRTAQPTHTGVPNVGVGVFVGADASAEIIGNTIKDNTVGIRSESGASAPVIVKNNMFDGNAKNGEFLKGYANWNLENSGNEDVNKKGGFDIQLFVSGGTEKILRTDFMPYIIRGGITVETGGTLEIEPGAVIKSAPNPQAPPVPIMVRGTLRARGNAEQPIIFTAFEDDSDRYDSDKVSSSPVPGAWKNIQFIGADASSSTLEYIIVRYGGQGENMCPYAYLGGPCMEYYGAVNSNNADVTIRHATLENNLGIAIFTEGNANPTIENSIIRDTKEAIETATTTIGGYGISIGPDSEPTVTDNTYANNKEDVVYRE